MEIYHQALVGRKKIANRVVSWNRQLPVQSIHTPDRLKGLDCTPNWTCECCKAGPTHEDPDQASRSTAVFIARFLAHCYPARTKQCAAKEPDHSLWLGNHPLFGAVSIRVHAAASVLLVGKPPSCLISGVWVIPFAHQVRAKRTLIVRSGLSVSV